MRVSKRDIDSTLPTRWNVIKSKKRNTDPMSHQLFGTIRRATYTSSSNRRKSNIHIPHTDSIHLSHKPTKRQQTMTSSRNKHYIDDYNFTNFIVNDSAPVTSGYLIRMHTKESYNIQHNDIHIDIADISCDEDNEDNNDPDHFQMDEVVYRNRKCPNTDTKAIDEAVSEDDDIPYEHAISIVDPEQLDACYEEIDYDDIDDDKKAEEEMDEYEHCGWLNQEEKRDTYPGMIHIKEIRKWQKTTGLLIPKQEFDSFVGNVIVNRYSNDVKFQLSAMLNLQEATEAFMIELFENASLFAVHDGREDVNEEDIQTVMKIYKKNKTEWGYQGKHQFE